MRLAWVPVAYVPWQILWIFVPGSKFEDMAHTDIMAFLQAYSLPQARKGS
jgi:hypothetical protein